VAVILTKKGEEIFVDDCDYERLCGYSWYLDKYGYAVAETKHNGERKKLRMHRMIMGVTDQKVLVDHINCNKIDNQKINLRVCNQSENARNRGASKNSQSCVKGLYYSKRLNQWKAEIMLNNKKYRKSFSCNIYQNAKELAIQWLEENRGKLHGDFSRS
jgi:hypothetical protein